MTVIEIPLDGRTQTSRIYHALREQIIDCRLLPGAKLKIAEIAETAEVSPGAVREALAKLTTEHLVISRDQFGFRVAPLSLDDATDLVSIRADIEAKAAILSVTQGDEAWERELRAAYAELVVMEGGPFCPEGALSHERFHNALLSGCGSPWTLRLRETLFRASERYRFFAARYLREARKTDVEHAALFAAAVSRDAEKTGDLVREHIHLTAQLIARALETDPP